VIGPYEHQAASLDGLYSERDQAVERLVEDAERAGRCEQPVSLVASIDDSSLVGGS
jgi:hypothetical protein